MTRELTELRQSNSEYRVLSVYGGTDIRAQMDTIRQGVEVVVCAPGRIWDLIERKAINLTALKVGEDDLGDDSRRD